MINIDFDIETIPSQLPWVREYFEEKTEDPTPPANYKKQDSIDKWLAENPKSELVDKAVESASFTGAACHILCISYAHNQDMIQTFAVDDTKDIDELIASEKRMILGFFQYLNTLQKKPTIRGHNIIGFDMKVLKQRAMILGVKIPWYFPVDPKPWDKDVYDTMLKWDSRDFVKMDYIARAFGIQGKGEIDGSMVYPMWQEGKLQEIIEYCEDDVRMGRELADKMTFNGF